jgi:hypothetical protein
MWTNRVQYAKLPMLNNGADLLSQLFQKFQNEEVEISMAQIEDEINSEQAKADALRAANPRAMQYYGQRLKEVRSNTSKEDQW